MDEPNIWGVDWEKWEVEQKKERRKNFWVKIKEFFFGTMSLGRNTTTKDLPSWTNNFPEDFE